MSSSTKNAQKGKKITIAYLQQRTKDLFTQDVMNASPFAKELYKLVRNKVKKLDDIQRIEERIKEVGIKNMTLTEEQQEKLQNKDNYMHSVQQTIEAFEIYRSTELAALMQKQDATPKASAAPIEEEHKAVPVPTAVEHQTTQTAQGVENKVIECSILQPEHKPVPAPVP